MQLRSPRRVGAALLFLFYGVSSSGRAATEDAQFNGRWDITVSGDNPRNRAWWLEVSGAGTETLKGKFVGAPGGQLEDIPKLYILDGELRFVFDRRYRREPRNQPQVQQRGLYWARLEEGKMKGTFEIEGDPSTYLEWTGVRAPVLPDKDDGNWKRGEPIQLFDGRDLTRWLPTAAGRPSGWSVKEGVLTNSPFASDLITERKYWNFDLHVEYQLTPHSNSGIGLRGRYEIQLFDDFGEPPSKSGNAALYGRIAPKQNVSKPAGEWQILDIRLIGRQLSESLNGTKVIEKAAIEGLTAIALDANESDPGPILLQGDHGPVQFRKITLVPLTPAPAPAPKLH